MENQHEEDESTEVTDRQLMESNQRDLDLVKEVLTLLIQSQSLETKNRLRSYVERFGGISPDSALSVDLPPFSSPVETLYSNLSTGPS